MDKIKLDDKSVAFCQGMIYERGALRPVAVPQMSLIPFETLSTPSALPEIEFGMQKAGTLSISDRFEVPARLAPATDAAGSGALATHPSTEAETLDGLNASRAISAAYDRAVAQQAEGKGLFCKPFFVRYAWRYADGQHSRPSAPVLMLPAVLPPCLAVLANEAVGDKRVLSFSPSSCRIFSLRCRVRDAGTAPGGVVALDFFISVPVSTHSADATLPRGVARWTSASAFVGHWSESGDQYADRTAEGVGLGTARAWHFPPNPTMESELLQSTDFYHVASLPIGKVASGLNFFDVPIDVATDAASLKACEKLQPGPSGPSPLDCSLEVEATARMRLDGRLYVAGAQLALPSPQSLRSMMAAAGASSDASAASTEVTVWAKRGGQIRSVTASWPDGPAANLADAFPRYIYYPCPGAFRMRLKQGTRTWMLPLTPAADSRGAYWWGGLEAQPTAPSSTTMPSTPTDNGTAGAFDSGCMVAISVQGNDQVWHTLTQCGNGAPVALASVPGQAIALTTKGIWRIGSPSRLISADACQAGFAPCRADAGLAYVSDLGLSILTGATVKHVPAPDPAPALPGLSLLAPTAPPQLAAPDAPPLIAIADEQKSSTSSKLLCDSNRLYAIDSTGRAMAYSLDSQAVGIPSESVLVVTRPFERPAGKRLTGLSAIGHFPSASVSLLLWGSHDGAAWTLVASSPTPLVRPVCGTPYRWYVAAIACPAHPASLLSLACAWR